MHLSICQISDFTGRDGRTVAKQLSNVPHIAGERGAMLYESTEALPLIYAVDTGGGACDAGPELGVVKHGCAKKI